MRIPYGTLILIADGRKLLLFRNAGTADKPALEQVEKREDENEANEAHRRDSAGRMYSSTGRASTYDEGDSHVREEQRFAREAASVLDRHVAAAKPEGIIVAADPHTLGELRRHYSDRVRRSLIREFPKDLIRHPVERIESVLTAQ